ncbi:hypothetical protein, partial [Paracoccus aerius]
LLPGCCRFFMMDTQFWSNASEPTGIHGVHKEGWSYPHHLIGSSLADYEVSFTGCTFISLALLLMSFGLLDGQERNQNMGRVFPCSILRKAVPHGR